MDLIEQWKDTKHKNERDFSRIVSKVTQKRNRNINEQADKVHDEVFSKIDCLDCANCCKSVPPMLTRTDIKRISKHLGLKPKAFEIEYLRKDDDGDFVMNTSPCTFLGADNECEIYDVRPKACRQYPHTSDFEFKENASLHARNAIYCPGVFHILNRLNQTEIKKMT